MRELAVITPSYAPDAELFGDLHASVLEQTSPRTVHHVIVPPTDRALFTRHAGARCRLWTYPELLPKRYVAVPRAQLWINASRPWPPVRGWVVQQALKIAAAAAMDTPTVLLADSDVVLVRPTSAERFTVDGRAALYRTDGGVHAGMSRHLRWHAAARRLLGLPPRPDPPLPDYVSPFNVWEPAVVRAMQARIEQATGRHWLDAFCSELHVSEFILYGVFVDEIGTGAVAPGPRSDTMFCHTYWDTAPLDGAAARRFAARLRPDDVAMMISAKSGTPREVRHVAMGASHSTAAEGRA